MKQMLARLIEPKHQIPENRKRFSNAQLQKLIFPIVIENFLALLVGLIDTLMISYAGEVAVSAVSLVNQLNAVFIMLFSALAAGGSVIASQYVGSRDTEKGSQAASQLVMLATLISLVVMAIVQFFGRAMLGALFGSAEPAVMENAMLYLRITACSIPFLAVYNACAGMYRSMGKTRTIMKVSMAMNAINVVGNAIGVLVLKAGVAGVAYPTLLSHIFAAAVMIVLAQNKTNAVFVRLSDVFRWQGDMVLRIFRIAVPNAIENSLFQASKVALSAIVAMFGTIQIAANGMAQSFWSMSALFSIAMGPAFITVIGQYMGAGDSEGADYYMKKLLRISMVGSFVWNLLFIAICPLMLQFSDLSDETIRLIILLVVIHNLPSPIVHPLAFPLSSGLRAAGDVKFTMYAALFGTVVCRVAFSVLFGIVMNMGVVGIALAMVVDWTIKGLLIVWRYRSGKWRNFKVI